MEFRDPAPTKFLPAERLPQEDVRQHSRSLMQSRPSLTLFEHIPTPVLIINPHRQIVYANRAFLNLTRHVDTDALIGLRPGEALNCMYSHVSEGRCGTTEYCGVCGAAQAVKTGMEGSPAEEECQILREGLENSAMDLRVCAEPFEQSGGRYVLISMLDVSGTKRHEIFERMFFHDVLNIATAIKGYTEVLGMQADRVRQEQYIRSLRMLSEELIDALRFQQDLSQAERQELTVHPREIDAGEFLGNIVQMYRELKVAQDREIIMEPAGATAVFVSDPGLLQRIVGNMIKNALEAVPPGEKVTAGWAEKEGGIEFRVHNPGVMPRDVQLQVFKRSFSTKGRGRGMGTYAIRKLSQDFLQGRVSFVSTVEGGTTFSAWFPRSIARQDGRG